MHIMASSTRVEQETMHCINSSDMCTIYALAIYQNMDRVINSRLAMKTSAKSL
jgi:hypothetical protein